MGSDRARVTYDPKQQYRSVVMQQGRVTLEADWNEAGQIANEELRKETLDFVGPCGTPDDGYEVVLLTTPTNPPFDFYIRSGTMYVGGMRTYLFDPVQYSNQHDWRDYGPEDPDWVDLSSFTASPSNLTLNEFVYLYLREQEISAVEDLDLKDVALGGPDTAQRTRLLQRFVRLASQGTDCVSGLAEAEAKWRTEGLYFDSATMRLNSWGALLVGFSDQGQNPDPCQPLAQGGYLNPDNQLIRVQISGIDQVTGNPKFLWGFDDASFLYRINVDPNDAQNLIFQSVPVDASHQPVRGQAVEVLRTAADLPNGGDVAATSGFVVTLDQNYNPDTQSVVLPIGVSLPLDYTSSNQSPANQLFLRVWQQEVVFTPGTSVPLGDTGVLVTLSLQTPGVPFHVGDYWLFAVRPATPQTVYPERYQEAPQPADGPRLWACPLGVIKWSEEVGTLVADCRNYICNLVDLCKRQQGCCTITVSPEDLHGTTTLQTFINQAASPTMVVQAANAGAPGNNISVQISNLDLNSSPPTFDLTVNETDLFLGISTTAGAFNGVAGMIGTDALAHVLGSVQSVMPLNNQIVAFTGGDANTKAQAKVMDSSNEKTVFTLEARNPGADGNLTGVTISNVDSAAATFDLALTWKKTLPGLNMATLFPGIQSNLGYVIVATPPKTVAPSFPAEGVTQLSGGTESNDLTGTNATTAQAAIFGNAAKICLRSGSYELVHPLILGPEQSNITIEACDGATLSAVLDNEEKREFLLGMMQLNGANNVTLSGLAFAMPRVVLFQAGATLAGLSSSSLTAIGEGVLISLDTSIALMVSGCQGLTVEDCRFNFPASQIEELLFAAAIFAGADCADVTLKGNVFEGPAVLKAVRTSNSTVPAFALAAGYIQADSLQSISLGAGGAGVVGGTVIPSTLDNIVISGNSFENLAFPVALTTALGAAKFADNIMRSCLTGFTILPLAASVAGITTAIAGDVRLQALNDPTTQRMLSIAVAHPRPTAFTPTRKIELVAAPASAAKAPTTRTMASNASEIKASGVLPTAGSRPITPIVNRITTSVVRISVAPLPVVAAPPVPAPPPAPGTPAPPAPAPAFKFEKLSPLTARVAQVFTSVSVSDIGIAKFTRDFDFSVQFSNNDIDAFVPGGGSLWALTIVDIAAIIKSLGGTPGPNTETTLGTLTMTGNRFRNKWSGLLSFTVSLMVDRCAVTGNIILNEGGEGADSLAIVVPVLQFGNIALAAVTGNVLLGTSALPPRTVATLPDWTTYNYTKP